MKRYIHVILVIALFFLLGNVAVHANEEHTVVGAVGLEDGKEATVNLLGESDEVSHGGAASSHEKEGEHKEEHTHAHFAILFPWFAQALGIASFFILTRYIVVVPYTAVMFLLGVFMGISSIKLDLTDQLHDSIEMWRSINSEVILLVFLPGLIFRDAFSLNVHLFQVSFAQCLVFAFPMVLAGTVLVALVAFYIFPYHWPFNLCMTFGSILAATDPVAVSALLNEVGAPPRLKTHISGESLLNDGSAIVFFTIFGGLFLHDLGVGLGLEIDVAKGFALFFRMSLGGAAIGLAFGFILVGVLFTLRRRLNEEENVLQVTATATAAYLCYYTAEAVAHTSGVIAVVFCGVFTKAFGANFINDVHLMESFWVLVEHLLNTLLFALGGVVWGGVIANQEPRFFRPRDWAYLFVLYILMTLIRFALFFIAYPITSRIGLKTNVKETIFISYGGLRGAVGIALAIALDNEVWEATDDELLREFTTELFGMVGGIAFLTLFVNGMTAGPLLKKLGLTKSSDVRERLTKVYETHMLEELLDNFLHFLSLPVFSKVDFEFVKHYIPLLRDLTPEMLKEAAIRNKASVPPKKYHPPTLDHLMEFLMRDCDQPGFDLSWIPQLSEGCAGATRLEKQIEASLHRKSLRSLQESDGTDDETKQLRLIFVEVLKSRYQHMIESGTLDVRSGAPGFVTFALEQGLEFAADHAENGQPLNDWEASFIVKRPVSQDANYPFESARMLRGTNNEDEENDDEETPSRPKKKGFTQLSNDVTRAYAFLQAHREAREYFRKEFCDDLDITNAERLVVLESELETQKALDFLATKNPDDVDNITAHILCTALLNKAVHFVEKMHAKGLLNDSEATEYVEEFEEQLDHVRKCRSSHLHKKGSKQVDFHSHMHEHLHEDTRSENNNYKAKRTNSLVESEVSV